MCKFTQSRSRRNFIQIWFGCDSNRTRPVCKCTFIRAGGRLTQSRAVCVLHQRYAEHGLKCVGLFVQRFRRRFATIGHAWLQQRALRVIPHRTWRTHCHCRYVFPRLLHPRWPERIAGCILALFWARCRITRTRAACIIRADSDTLRFASWLAKRFLRGRPSRANVTKSANERRASLTWMTPSTKKKCVFVWVCVWA